MGVKSRINFAVNMGASRFVFVGGLVIEIITRTIGMWRVASHGILLVILFVSSLI